MFTTKALGATYKGHVTYYGRDMEAVIVSLTSRKYEELAHIYNIGCIDELVIELPEVGFWRLYTSYLSNSALMSEGSGLYMRAEIAAEQADFISYLKDASNISMWPNKTDTPTI